MTETAGAAAQPALFGEVGSTRPDVRRDEQWRLETLLLCNWGGFGGITAIDMDPDSTLLSGASGTGKSTILDAYTALLNPARPFNVASNEAGERRRSEGTRTTLTYVRGQYDRAERDGVLVPLVLRGNNQDTWSALSAVFTATGGAHLTLLRIFFAPQEASVWSEMSPTYGVFDGRLEKRHIEMLEPLANNGFRKDHVEKALPGLRIVTQGQYIEQVQSRLHIGVAGGGTKALKLLHELQSGKPQPSVDALFKQMVLDEPVTFAEADKAIESFDKLDEGYREIVTKENQHAVLEHLEADHDEFIRAREEIERIDTLRVAATDRSPFLLWVYRRRAEAYAENIVEAKENLAAAEAERAFWTGERTTLESRRAEVQARYRAGGGGSREDLELVIGQLQEQRRTVARVRGLFEDKIRSFVPPPATLNEFATVQRQARRFLDSYESAAASLAAEKNALLPDYFALKQRIKDEETELQHLKTHRGNIPARLHEVRDRFAAAAGLQPSDLPFAGELLDVHPDHEAWRVATDAVLGGFAVTLLVDERRLRHLRRSVNGIRSDVRLNFEGVATGAPVRATADERTLAGCLVVQDGPFAGWLRGHLDGQYDYECVETVEELVDDGGRRVTREGQTQRGRRGAHGGNTLRRIGFSNERRQAEIDDLLNLLKERLQQAEAEVDELDRETKRLEQQRIAWEAVSEATWSDVDVAAVDRLIEQAEESLSRLIAGSPELDELARQIEELTGQSEHAFEESVRYKLAAEKYQKQFDELTDEAETLRPLIAELEADDSIRLSEEQTEQLNTRAGQAIGWDGTGASFDVVVKSIRKEIENELSGSKMSLSAAADRLTGAFGRFQAEWPDNSRGVGLASYGDYLAILQDLRAHGLAAQRETWSRKVIEYSGDRLSVLSNSYGRARDEINERLGPIRHILRQIQFGSRDGRTLDINVDHRRPESVTAFQQQLRKLAEGAMIPVIDTAAAEAKFEAIRDFLSRVRPKSVERDGLLDVRRHLKVTAQVLDDEIPVSAYDHISDKSGGEAQMITAFICGAALRYQLGDEDRDRPRFAPVVLDEAFIKADGRYTKLAVEAWQLLGFQLVIGAPEDKFNAIEPAMGLVIGVTKDLDEHSYVVPAPRKKLPAP